MSLPLNIIKLKAAQHDDDIWMPSLYDRYKSRPEDVLFLNSRPKKINVIAKVGIYTAREKEETDGIQEEYNVEQEEKNYATQTEKNNVAQEEPLVDETKCTSANVFKSKDTILGPQLTTFLVDSINSILKYVKSHDEMLRQLRQDIDGKNEVSSFNEGASQDTFQELILKDNQTFKDITLVLSESSDLDKFLSDIKDSLTSSAKSIRKKKVLPSLPATRQWKPPQDELADVLSAVDVVLSSKDNVSTTDNSQFLSSYDVESVNRPMTPSSSSGSQQSTTSTGQLVIPSACYLAQPLTIAPALELEVATSATVALSVTRTNGASFRFKSTHEIIMEPPEAPSVKVNESIEIDTTTQPGGWLIAACPHSVVYAAKSLLRGESPRDFVDLMRSFKHRPNILICDIANRVAASGIKSPACFIHLRDVWQKTPSIT
ncbi:unnamed protein product [Mytilus edulis]|uniref:Uncharacterized protein n=1 Tax=Mytilus edulis TaxID=6550 RepID=A0A8S3SRY4_MYTED|nr:unnamed protein product [Mytilus edulis]